MSWTRVCVGWFKGLLIGWDIESVVVVCAVGVSAAPARNVFLGTS